MDMINIIVGDTVYYARILPSVDEYEIIELKIRTSTDDYFVGIDSRTKHAYLFNSSDIDVVIFTDRKQALKKVKNAQKNRKKNVSSEIYYKEY